MLFATMLAFLFLNTNTTLSPYAVTFAGKINGVPSAPGQGQAFPEGVSYQLGSDGQVRTSVGAAADIAVDGTGTKVRSVSGRFRVTYRLTTDQSARIDDLDGLGRLQRQRQRGRARARRGAHRERLR